MAQSIEKPPSVYGWIEENSYICTFVTMDDQPEITFLSEVDGAECSSCPEVPTHLVPRQACATIKRPKEDIVHISCQPLPELCVIEFRNRYSEFFQRVEKNFEKHLILKNIENKNIAPSLALSNSTDTTEKKILSETPLLTRTTKIPSLRNSKLASINDRLRSLSLKNPIKDHLMKIDLKQKFAINNVKENETEKINFIKNISNNETSITTINTHRESILSPSINKQFDEGSPMEKNFTLNEKNNIITSFSLPSQNQSNTQLFQKNKRISNSTSTISRNSQSLFLNNISKTNTITEDNIFNDSFLYKKDNEICEDKNKICCFWALTGECTTNPFWMRINCPRACGTCGCKLKNADKCISTGIKCQLPTTTISTIEPPSTIISTTQKPTTKKIINLENDKTPDIKKLNKKLNKDANIFSTIFGGKMYSNNKNIKQIINTGITFPDRTTKMTTIMTTTSFPTTISTTTLLTSTDITSRQKKLPTTTEKPCKDYHKNCKFWALLGECTKNPFWMKTQCEKSCNTCGIELEKIFAPTPHPGCYNHHKLCQFWSFNGECEKNPNWMLVKCKLSCRVC